MADWSKLTSEQQLRDDLRGHLDAEFRRAFLGGWPEGYQPGKGVPGTLTADDIEPRKCWSPIIGDREPF